MSRISLCGRLCQVVNGATVGNILFQVAVHESDISPKHKETNKQKQRHNKKERNPHYSYPPVNQGAIARASGADPLWLSTPQSEAPKAGADADQSDRTELDQSGLTDFQLVYQSETTPQVIC
jgi:hypothetical protein